ncbi:hypothetical protein DXG01_000649 [Tephrocybe rancida]|nr:hypothetical protein DXG01_000649 [Tephrocybe rancida]
MPPDPTRMTTRRTQRKITEEELKDIELKRIKGANCHVQNVDASSCDAIRKFLAGLAVEEDAKAFVRVAFFQQDKALADTDQLHKKIADMSHRIRQLEDALAILQATVSDQRHPLLQDDLLKVKFGPEATDGRQQSSSPSQVEDKLTQPIDALGTLTLGDSGDVKYFGRSAGSETLIMAGEESDDEEAEERIPHEFTNSDTSANQFPFSSKPSTSTTIALLESHLPSQERAYALGDSYLKHAANFFRPIKRDELFDSFMPAIYKAAAARQPENEIPGGSPDASKAGPGSSGILKNSPHALATLYFLFALGALLDLSLPPYNTEAEHYYELGRSALALRVVFDSPQMYTVQAMGLMATYHCFAGKKFHRDSAIGLHRDSARWKMDPKTVQKRRTLFWEVFTADVSHSLALGRPPAMHLSYVDCEFPIDEEATLNDKGEIQNGFWRMKYTFGRDLFLSVSDATLVAKSPDYSTILEIDRKVREIPFPTSFKPYVTRQDGDELYYSSSHSLQGFYASQHRTVTMLYLHRSYFAQAMLDHPTNPLLSPFSPSFLTALRSASVIIRASAHQFDRCAEMAMRVWFLMYHTFSAAIIVGTVVTRSPTSDMAPGALEDLCRAVDLFERTALQSQRAKIALGVLRRLKEKAVRVYGQHKSNRLPAQTSTSPSNPLLLTPNVDDGDDDLAIFGGQTRVVSRKSRHKRATPPTGGMSDSPSPPDDSSGSPTGPTEASDLPSTTPPTSVPEIPPTLLEYMEPHHGSHSAPAPSSSFPRSSSNGNHSNHAVGDMGVSPSLTVSDLGQSQAQQTHNDIFANLMGYMASKPAENLATNPLNVSPLQYTQGQPGMQDLHEWRALSPDPTGFPKPDNSFNWVPPAQSQRAFNQQQSHQAAASPVPAVYIPTSSSHQHQTMSDSLMQTQSSPPSSYPDGHSYFPGYEPPPVSTGYDSSANMVTDPTEALFELGLMRGSDIDSGWLNYMQDCGIMDTSSGPSLLSSTTFPSS